MDDQKLELVNRGGHTFFVPAERESSITNFHKWEQAFRAYSNIHTQEHPDRATELIQYNHVIFTASSSYQWQNIYLYDREFRTHLSYYREHSWGIILQQAWLMHLKDRINQGFNNGQGKFGNNNNNHSRACHEACKRFNKGLCTAGRGCKYNHRCLECGKFGHGAHICRNKAGADGKVNNSVPSGGANAAAVQK